MSNKDTVFYRGNTSVSVDFSAEDISSDGAVVLLEKIEKQTKLLQMFSKVIKDSRDRSKTRHSPYKLLKQRVFMLMQGYEDCNDVTHLQNDPVFKDILGGELASQPTLSRFENSINKQGIMDLSYAWLDRYVASLAGRKEVIIDIDATNDPTHGQQQLSMFHGYYGMFMYNELFFHDGLTGQIILPVLRPGNSHSNKWYVSILKRIIKAIRTSYKDIHIFIRADGGFSCAPFYQLADEYDLKYAIGLPSNSVLKKQVARVENAVKFLYADHGIKHQHFITFDYSAKSWHKSQSCYSKVESTGLGMNIRHIVSNMEGKTGREIYFEFYVKRGETSENRIKEVKNMCYSDRLSNHSFWANFFRLFISSLAYEIFLIIKSKIQKTKAKKAKKWDINSIRTHLLKVAATIKVTKKRIYYQLSKAFMNQGLFKEIMMQK
jgi:hypothetical protein